MRTYHEEKSGTCAFLMKLIQLLHTNTAPIIQVKRRNAAFIADYPLSEKSLSKYKDEVKPLRENPASRFLFAWAGLRHNGDFHWTILSD